MDSDTRIEINSLKSRLSNIESEVRICNETDRKMRILIRQLDESLAVMVESVGALIETQLTITETQQKILVILKNHHWAKNSTLSMLFNNYWENKII